MVIPGKCFSSPAGVGGSHLANIPALVFLSLCRLPLPLCNAACVRSQSWPSLHLKPRIEMVLLTVSQHSGLSNMSLAAGLCSWNSVPWHWVHPVWCSVQPQPMHWYSPPQAPHGDSAQPGSLQSLHHVMEKHNWYQGEDCTTSNGSLYRNLLPTLLYLTLMTSSHCGKKFLQHFAPSSGISILWGFFRTISRFFHTCHLLPDLSSLS